MKTKKNKLKKGSFRDKMPDIPIWITILVVLVIIYLIIIILKNPDFLLFM
jgi:hypothetical protein